MVAMHTKAAYAHFVKIRQEVVALLFLVMIFVSAAVIGALLLVSSSNEPGGLISTGTFQLARAIAYVLVNV